MGSVQRTITLTDQQNAWIKAQMDGGGYADASEFIGELIRREQERTLELERIRQSLVDGEKSGEAQPFNVNAFLDRMQKTHG